MALYKSFINTYSAVITKEENKLLEAIVGKSNDIFEPSMENLSKIKYCAIELYKFIEEADGEEWKTDLVNTNKKIARLANALATFDAGKLSGKYFVEYFKCVTPGSQRRILVILDEYPFLIDGEKKSLLREIEKKKKSPMILMSEVVFSINSYME